MSNLKAKHQQIAKFIPAKKAKHYKTLSLVSSAPKKEHVLASLKAISEDIEIALRNEIRKIVSDPQIQVELCDFFEDKPKKRGFVHAASLPDNPDAKAFMHIQPNAFGSLSELFFGGSPSNLSNKDLAKKPVTDTEKRLSVRLFNVFLSSITEVFKGQEDMGWNQQWIERLKEEDVLWTTAKVSSDEGWEFCVNFAWPYAITDEDDSEEEAKEIDLSESLEKLLVNVVLSLKTVVAKTSINITDIANLKKGDILPISLPSQVTAKSGNNVVLSGSICEYNERLGLKIEHNTVGVDYE